MEEEVKDIMAQVLSAGRELIVDSLTMDKCDAWDSLRHMELVAAIEAKLECELSFEEIVSMTTFAGVCQIVKAHTISKGA